VGRHELTFLRRFEGVASFFSFAYTSYAIFYIRPGQSEQTLIPPLDSSSKYLGMVARNHPRLATRKNFGILKSKFTQETDTEIVQFIISIRH
jgi:hypothetical protein